MKKLIFASLAVSLFIISGCSVKTDNQTTSQKTNGILDNTINTIDTKRLEAHDQYLISKTKEIETMVQLYASDNTKYPVILDLSGIATTTKIYSGSENWNKLKNLILSSPSLKGLTTDVSETVTVSQPIEYFSNGDTYTFKVYLNYDKSYNIGGNDFKCQTKEGVWCVLTINSES